MSRKSCRAKDMQDLMSRDSSAQDKDVRTQTIKERVVDFKLGVQVTFNHNHLPIMGLWWILARASWPGYCGNGLNSSSWDGVFYVYYNITLQLCFFGLVVNKKTCTESVSVGNRKGLPRKVVDRSIAPSRDMQSSWK